jgi:L-ascorbate metabolism protein UlaG (beta-lactamase superfamily)
MLADVVKNITWLGHDGFRIAAGRKLIFIDPFQMTASGPADIILITHSHYDHLSPEDIKKLQTDSTVIIADADSARKLSGDVRVMQPGDSIIVNGIPIEAVPAYNIGKKFHPKNKRWLGYIITVDDCRIYHAGDTDLIDEMSGLRADIAILPVSGTYVMTAAEAVQAAKRIKPKLAIPMHYDSLVGSVEDARAFAQGLSGVCEVKILIPYEHLT